MTGNTAQYLARIADASGTGVASGAADSGNPVKIGGVAVVGGASYGQQTNGQRADAVMLNGALVTAIGGATATVDGAFSNFMFLGGNPGNATQLVPLGVVPQVFDGTALRAVRGDANGTVVQPALSSTFWGYTVGAGGIVSSVADVVLKVASGAGVRNYLKTLTLQHDLLSAATEYVIKDGAAIIHRGKLQTSATDSKPPVIFDPPLRGSANTAMNFALVTSVTGGVYVGATGYTGA